MRTKASPGVEIHILRAIAVRASADPRSVARVLAGERVRGLVGDRIRSAIAALHTDPTPPTT